MEPTAMTDAESSPKTLMRTPRPMRATVILCMLCVAVAGSPGGFAGTDTPTTPGAASPPGAAKEPGGSANPQRPFTEGIALSTTDDGLDQGQTATRFNFAATRDLWVRVRLASVRRHTLVTLSFIDPSGNVFYEDYLMFSPDTPPVPPGNPDQGQGPAGARTVFPAR